MSDPIVSVGEIKKHASGNDCWIVVDDVVWDITEFAPTHPGGKDSECEVDDEIDLCY
jgi:L-lactate dehydrogenase (cytochrome)